jgi:hypothetical protein
VVVARNQIHDAAFGPLTGAVGLDSESLDAPLCGELITANPAADDDE